VQSHLKNHYKAVLDLLNKVAPVKQTFTSSSMTSQQFLHCPLSFHQSLHDLENGVFESVLAERSLTSLEDLFCQLIVRTIEDPD